MLLNRVLIAGLFYVVCWYIYRDPTFEAGIKAVFLADLSMYQSEQLLLDWWDGIWFGLNLLAASIIAIPVALTLKQPETEEEKQWSKWVPLLLFGAIALFVIQMEGVF